MHQFPHNEVLSIARFTDKIALLISFKAMQHLLGDMSFLAAFATACRHGPRFKPNVTSLDADGPSLQAIRIDATNDLAVL